MVPVDTYITSEGEEKTTYLELRFLDSYKFKRGSLDSLVKMLKDDQFKTLTSQMPDASEEQLKLLKQKGIFPYDLMTDFSKLSRTTIKRRIP